jgi:hypothetical protein
MRKMRGADEVTKVLAQRLALGVASLFLLAGCGTSDDAVATDASPRTTASAVSSGAGPAATTAEAAATPAEATEPISDEALRAAVQGYSDGFLGGDPSAAYDYFSARCKERVSLSYFTGIVMAAGQVYGSALPITGYDAQISGDLARVTYGYDVPALDQTKEPWTREAGSWKQDDC